MLLVTKCYNKDKNHPHVKRILIVMVKKFTDKSIEKERILVVDDDPGIRDLVSQFLGNHHYAIDTAADGRGAFTKISVNQYDLVVLDLMLPGEDGLSICQRLRAQSQVPIIMLTALGEETDRIVGLEMGADDYLPKPFNPRELLARIKAILRRYKLAEREKLVSGVTEVAVFNEWRLNFAKRELKTPNNVLLPLTTGEYELLLAFIDHPQRVLDRDQLMDITKGRTTSPFDRSIDVQLSRLRKKIETNPKNPEMIKTVRSGGYIFTPQVERISCE